MSGDRPGTRQPWWRTLWSAVEGFIDDGAPTQAAALSFHTASSPNRCASGESRPLNTVWRVDAVAEPGRARRTGEPEREAA